MKHNHEEVQEKVVFNRYDHSYIKMARDRNIFVSEDITNKLAAELSAMLLYYDHQSPEEPINMYLNTNGGASSGLVNIYDVMQMISSPINTICIGKCYSAGAIILAAGTKGQRYAYSNSQIMIHNIQFNFPIPGHDITNSKNYYQYVKDHSDTIMKILANHTEQELSKIKQDCTRDVYMNAHEAVEYGIVDHVL